MNSLYSIISQITSSTSYLSKVAPQIFNHYFTKLDVAIINLIYGITEYHLNLQDINSTRIRKYNTSEAERNIFIQIYENFRLSK